MKRAVIYARVSGDDRSKEDRNLKSQLEMGREYAQEHSYTVVAELAEDDRGASGAEIDLPQLNQVREMARAGEFDILVVREIDRLSRNLAKQLIIEQELKQAGVAIEYVLGEYPDTPEGNFMKHVRATVAEFEREKVAERTMRGRQDKARAGYYVTRSRPPYGYRVVEGQKSLVIYKPEAQVVRLVFTLYTAGDDIGGPIGMRQIARRLTDMRVPTWTDVHGMCGKRAGVGEWGVSSVDHVLSNESYTGRWSYAGVAVEIPSIIDGHTWMQAVARRSLNRQMSRRNRKYDYLLAGRVRCGLCGAAACGASKLLHSGNGVLLYYHCNSSQWLPARDCSLPYIRADHVDAAVWQWVTEFLTNPEVLASGLLAEQGEREKTGKPLRDRLAVVDGLLAGRQDQLGKLLDLYLDSGFPREVLADRQKQLEDGIAGLGREREILVGQLAQETLPDETIRDIVKFAGEVALDLEAAGQSYEARRRIVDMLDVRVTLTLEDGEKIVYASMLCGDGTFPVVSTSSRGGSRNRPMLTACLRLSILPLPSE